MVTAYSTNIVVCELSEVSLDNLVQIESESNRPAWNRALFQREFSNRYSTIYGARLLGRLVGFLVCHVVLDEGHVVNFGVLQDSRGRGVGRELITSVLWRLQEEGVRWATLEVRRSNQAAIKLYTSLGFLESGIRQKYYSDDGEDGLLMRLDLRQFMDIHCDSPPMPRMRSAG